MANINPRETPFVVPPNRWPTHPKQHQDELMGEWERARH